MRVTSVDSSVSSSDDTAHLSCYTYLTADSSYHQHGYSDSYSCAYGGFFVSILSALLSRGGGQQHVHRLTTLSTLIDLSMTNIVFRVRRIRINATPPPRNILRGTNDNLPMNSLCNNPFLPHSTTITNAITFRGATGGHRIRIRLHHRPFYYWKCPLNLNVH